MVVGRLFDVGFLLGFGLFTEVIRGQCQAIERSGIAGFCCVADGGRWHDDEERDQDGLLIRPQFLGPFFLCAEENGDGS